MREQRASDWLIGDLQQQKEAEQAIQEQVHLEDPYQVKPLVYETQKMIQHEAQHLFGIVVEYVDQNFKNSGAPARRYRSKSDTRPFDARLSVEYGGDLGVTMDFLPHLEPRPELAVDPLTGLESVLTNEEFYRLYVRGDAKRYIITPKRYSIPLSKYTYPNDVKSYPKARLIQNTNGCVEIERTEKAQIIGGEEVKEISKKVITQNLNKPELEFRQYRMPSRAAGFLLATTLPYGYGGSHTKRERLTHDRVQYGAYDRNGGYELTWLIRNRREVSTPEEERLEHMINHLQHYGVSRNIGPEKCATSTQEKLDLYVHLAKEDYLAISEEQKEIMRRLGGIILSELK